MRRIILPIVSFILFAAVSSAQEDTDARIKRVEEGLLPAVQVKGESGWTIQQRMERYKAPGVSVAVINNFRIDWAKGYGVKDKTANEPVTAQTMFQAASISKTLNATVVMKRVQEGKLSLDENVNAYLHSWKLPDNDFTAKKKVTVANLLSHTGGTTVSGFPGYRSAAPLPTIQQILSGEPPANTGTIIVDIEPAQRWRYSGGGTTILQLVLLELEKKPYAQIIKDIVLDPLGMNNSTFSQPLPKEWEPKAATAHRPDDKPVPGKWHVYPEQAAAGLWTTPTDLAKFAIEHQLSVIGKSNKILSPEMEEKMMTPYIGEGYGLGFGVQRMGNAVYFQHSGGNEGFVSLMIAHKKGGYGAVVMVNSNAFGIIPEIMRSIAKEYEWEGYLPAPYEKVAIAPDLIERITGRYLLDADRVVNISGRDGRIVADVTRMSQMELIPTSEREFISREEGYRVTFARGATPANDTVRVAGGGPPMQAARMANGQRVPFEYLCEGAFDEAISRYKGIKKSDSSNSAVQQNTLNRVGYYLMYRNKLREAIVIFQLNKELYPQSWDVYDSLGEAYAANGDRDLAIKNYKKALELNPKNTGAVEALKKLQKE